MLNDQLLRFGDFGGVFLGITGIGIFGKSSQGISPKNVNLW